MPPPASPKRLVSSATENLRAVVLNCVVRWNSSSMRSSEAPAARRSTVQSIWSEARKAASSRAPSRSFARSSCALTSCVRLAAVSVTRGSWSRGIAQQLAAHGEEILAPHFDLGELRLHALALDRIVVDEDEALERKTELLGHRADVAGLVVPVDAPGDEIVRRQQALMRVVLRVFPQLAHRRLVVLAGSDQQDPAPLQRLQRLVDAEIEADIGIEPADLVMPGEGRAGLRQHARPQRAVEIDDDDFLALEPEHDPERIDMGAGSHRLARVGIAADELRQGRGIREDLVDGGKLARRALQHPAG